MDRVSHLAQNGQIYAPRVEREEYIEKQKAIEK